MSRLNYFQNRPKLTKIDTASYLRRIHLAPEPPSINFLRKLHRSHLLHIPFENLDIHYQKKIILNYEKIYQKLILEGRGGYCYELNGLFYHLLYHLGFNCHLISARIRNEKSGEFGKEYEHMAIIVKFGEESWLADIGYGKYLIYPKKIVLGEVQMDYTDYWRFTQDADENFLVQSSEDTSYFKTKYLFSTEEKQIIQFMEMNDHQQTSPESHFTQGRMITKLTPTGRITLTEKKIKILALGKTEEIELTNEDEFYSKLEQHFGITFKQLVRAE